MPLNLLQLSKEDLNVNITISLSDLVNFHKEVITDTKRQLEEEIKAAHAEAYLTIDEVKEILSVDRSTLWRWDKAGYLKPISIGGKKRYSKSSIEALLKGGN